MLRLPRFGFARPRDLVEACELLSEPGTRILAGGTDLLPNLKHRLEAPVRLVGVGQIEALRVVQFDDQASELRLGAALRLSELEAIPRLRELFPSFAEALGAVASPTIRNMATVGGNLHLEPRCRFVNQTEFWRSAIGGCLKSEGSVCHVVPGGTQCVAAFSSDCAPALMSLGASLVLEGRDGTRTVGLEQYYGADGCRHTQRAAGELLREIRVPYPRGYRRCRYVKWTVRGSIDFPLVSIALRFDAAGAGRDAPIEDVRVVVGVLGSRPREVTRLQGVLGRPLGHPDVASLVAERVQQQCRPLANVHYEVDYRHRMLGVLTRRAVAELSPR